MSMFGSTGQAPQKFAEPTKYDSIFWVAADRIEPNPYQPRLEFDEERLKALAESIRQYGVLQPLVVTRKEVETPLGLQSTYELIAGERRLRASKLIGLKEVPVVIRAGEQTDKMKLELAIIENLQREDLNAIDRAKALAKLVEEFGLSHSEVGAKVGRSREYVSNSIRLLQLPEEIQMGIVNKEISEGHARALLMLNDRPQERDTLFKEIVLKKTSVRIVEQLARRLAQDKIRKHNKTPEMMELEKSLTETLGTRVLIENRPKGGRLLIEFFSPDDLSHIAAVLASREAAIAAEELQPVAEAVADPAPVPQDHAMVVYPNTTQLPAIVPETVSIPAPEAPVLAAEVAASSQPTGQAQSSAPAPKADEDLYSIRNFTV